MISRRAAAAAVVAIIAICLVPGTGQAQECDAYEEYIHLVGAEDVGGVAYDVALWDDYAYLVDPFLWALYIMDITNPQLPTLVTTVELEVYPQAVAIQAGYLYMATTTGLTVMTLTDPINPQPHGSLPLSSASVDLVVEGAYAYVAELDVGLQVVDISDPAAPELRHTVASTPRRIALQGDHVYLAVGGTGMQIVDISTPESASIVGSLPLPGFATGIDVLADHAYVAVGDEGLQAIVVVDPTQPQLVGSLDLPRPLITVDIAQGSGDEFAVVFSGDEGPFATVDLTLPAQPNLITYFGGDAYTAAFQDGLAFVANFGWGLYIYDVSNPAAREPFHTGDVESTGQDIASGDNLIFVASAYSSEGNLQVFSLTDPYHPELQSTLPLIYRSEKVAGAGSYALVYGDTQGDGAQVLVVDATDPTLPLVAETWEFESLVRAIEVNGNFAYVLHDLDPPMAEFHSQLQVMEITDATNPVLRGAVLLPAALGLAVDGPRGAVTCDYSPGWIDNPPLVLLDLADPDDPYIHALTGVQYVTERVAMNGYLVVTGEQEGPLPISRRNYSLDFYLYPYPGSGADPPITHLGTGIMLSPASELIVTRSHVFASGQVFDFSLHTQPFCMGSTYDMGPARILHDGLIYAVNSGFMAVYPAQCEFVVAVEDEEEDLPGQAGRLLARPNPFNPRTEIVFNLAVPTRVRIAIYDLAGRLVVQLADRQFTAGEHGVAWDGTDAAGRGAAAGAYLVRWEGGGASSSQKILLAR